ncbi:MAG: hypothetical protein EZS28_041924, partial [Streblomastix strix]
YFDAFILISELKDEYISNILESQLINCVPSALIVGTVLPQEIINPLPSYPISFSRSQSGQKADYSARFGSFGAKFVEDKEDDVEVQQSLKILEWKLHLVHDFSLCKIIPPDSSIA